MPPKTLNICLFTSILFLFLSACGASDPDVVPLNKTSAIQLIDSVEIHETDDRFIGHVAGVDVKLNPFRLYIADGEMGRVAVVSRDGEIKKLIGRPGKGPGELQSPSDVLVGEDYTIVRQGQRAGFEVFDRSGAYKETYHLPAGNWTEGMYSSMHAIDNGYLLPVTSVDPREHGVQASAEQATIAAVNRNFQIVETFGTFPTLYQEGEYAARQRTADVAGDSTLAVGYRLVPDIQLYDIGPKEVKQRKTLSLSHPKFQVPKEEIPMEIAREEDELYERLAEVSGVEHTALFEEGIFVHAFANQTKAFYESKFDEEEQTHYAIFGKVDANTRLHLKLPGRVLAHDENDRLYVELNPTPDNRKIGIYEVNWPSSARTND